MQRAVCARTSHSMQQRGNQTTYVVLCCQQWSENGHFPAALRTNPPDSPTRTSGGRMCDAGERLRGGEKAETTRSPSSAGDDDRIGGDSDACLEETCACTCAGHPPRGDDKWSSRGHRGGGDCGSAANCVGVSSSPSVWWRSSLTAFICKREARTARASVMSTPWPRQHFRALQCGITQREQTNGQHRAETEEAHATQRWAKHCKRESALVACCR
jgi:hypothetical protein